MEEAAKLEPREPSRAGWSFAAAAKWASAERLLLGGVLVITALAYLRSLGNGFVWDDIRLIVTNQHIGQWSFLWKSLIHDEYWFKDPAHLPQSSRYRPLLLIWSGLNYHLFGLHPAGWHAMMVAVHLVAVWLVFKVASRLTGDWQTGLLAALLFGVAPLNVDGVGWVAGFGLPLAAVFELGAFSLIANRGVPRIAISAAAAGLYAGALLSHESAVAFPGLVAAYFLLLDAPEPWRAGPAIAWRRIRRAAVATAPFALEVLLYLVARRLVLGFALNAPDAAPSVSGAPALLSVPRVFVTYLVVLTLPWLAGPAHPEQIVTSITSPGFYAPVAALIVAVALVMWYARDSAQRRLYLLCCAWMVIALSPMLDLPALRRDLFVQDAYFYLSSVGWWVMVGDLICRTASARTRFRIPMASVAVILLAVNIASLWRTQGFFHDNAALFTRAVEEAPDTGTWHRMLGVALGATRGDLTGAERELLTASRYAPLDPPGLYDLGFVHWQLGRFKQAEAELRQALAGMPQPPPYAYVVLAKACDAAGDPSGAEAALKHLESMPQGSELADLTRVQLRMKHGDVTGAEAVSRELSKRYPADPQVWRQLGSILTAEQRNEEALEAYQHALALVPGDVQIRFLAAQSLHALGRDREALAQCRIAQGAAPKDPGVQALMIEIERALAHQ